MGDEGRTRSFSCESLCDFSYLHVSYFFPNVQEDIYAVVNWYLVSVYFRVAKSQQTTRAPNYLL